MSNNLNYLWAQLLIEEFTRNKIDYFCISPGSRSTPLVAAVARNEKAKKNIFFDERGCAFHALGYAIAKNKPAVVITTSGTAVANLFPAIIEASLSKIPMIILTADRPPELLDVGANQTIDQDKIFGKYVKWSFNFPCPDENINPKMILTTVDYCVYLSNNSPSGPVHLNFMFREPLEPIQLDQNYLFENYAKDIKKWFENKRPYTIYEYSKKIFNDVKVLKEISSIINKEEKGLISIGKIKNDEDKKSILKFIKKINWPVYADISSNLRLNDYIGTNIIKHFDQELLSKEFNNKVRPETVIHFGERITSKRFDQFLNDNKPKNYIIIKDNPIRYDPAHIITMHIECDISYFCNNILKLIEFKKENNFKNFYEEKAKKTQEIIEENLKNENELKVNEIFISRCISKEIPNNSCLFLSNSMPIRDLELYGESSKKNIIIGVNRGASGIDGIISSAAGFANGSNKLCTLLIGDLAFIHDINSLLTIKSLNVPMIIVLINNNGGGIFDFLNISKYEDIFEKYFVAPHNLSFKDLAKSFDLNYYSVFNNEDFVHCYKNSLKIAKINSKSSLIEVFTERKLNLQIRKKIKKEIIQMLEQ